MTSIELEWKDELLEELFMVELTPWEEGFCQDMSEKEFVSEKQLVVLEDLRSKYLEK